MIAYDDRLTIAIYETILPRFQQLVRLGVEANIDALDAELGKLEWELPPEYEYSANSGVAALLGPTHLEVDR